MDSGETYHGEPSSVAVPRRSFATSEKMTSRESIMRRIEVMLDNLLLTASMSWNSWMRFYGLGKLVHSVRV